MGVRDIQRHDQPVARIRVPGRLVGGGGSVVGAGHGLMSGAATACVRSIRAYKPRGIVGKALLRGAEEQTMADTRQKPFRLTVPSVADALSRTAIAYVADRRYLPLAVASAASAAAHLTSRLPVRLFTVDVPDPAARAARDHLRALGLQAETVPLEMRSGQTDLSRLKTPRDSISAAAYGRLTLPDLLPEVETLIYLDGDTLIEADLTELALLAPHSLAAVESLRPPGDVPKVYRLNALDPAPSYFNSGICVIDAGFWRRQDLTGQAVTLAADSTLTMSMPDQDVLNLIFGRVYHRLHPRWNFTKGTSWIHPAMRPAIAHFAGRIYPWDPRDRRCPQVYRDRYAALFAAMPTLVTDSLDTLMMPKVEQDRARAWWPVLERAGLRRKSGWNPAHAAMLARRSG
jgi:lipopolysaccharide biosynthesis glycosyltransferase